MITGHHDSAVDDVVDPGDGLLHALYENTLARADSESAGARSPEIYRWNLTRPAAFAVFMLFNRGHI